MTGQTPQAFYLLLLFLPELHTSGDNCAVKDKYLLKVLAVLSSHPESLKKYTYRVKTDGQGRAWLSHKRRRYQIKALKWIGVVRLN